MEHIEHPEIGWAMRTGYPSWNQPNDELIHCDVCGEDITDTDQYWDDYNDHLCVDCLLRLHLRDD